MIRFWLAAALGLTALAGAGALEGELQGRVRQTLVEVVQGPPGTAPSEVAVHEFLFQATASHRQVLVEGLSAEATGWASVDTLPSGSPLALPAHKLALSAKLLEGWVRWEPLPAALAFGTGKRIVRPSSGFAYTPLNLVTRGGETPGAQAVASWEEGWVGAEAAGYLDAVSASVYYAPELTGDQVAQEGFVQGRVNLSLGTTDLRAVALRKGTTNRGGLGLDSGWGDALTLRAETAADADPAAPKPNLMAGFTWAAGDQTTVMAEYSADGRSGTWVQGAFLRVAGKLDDRVEAEGWAKVDLGDRSGLAGTTITWSAPKWAVSASWLGAWTGPSTPAVPTALRWRTELVVKTFW